VAEQTADTAAGTPDAASGRAEPLPPSPESQRAADPAPPESPRRADKDKRRPAKFDYLVTRGLITANRLASAIADAKRRQIDVESVLVEQYQIPKAEVGKSLSLFYNCPYLAYDSRTPIDPDLLKDLKIAYLKKSLWIPLRREGESVVVLMDDPTDLQKMDHIERMFGKNSVQVAVALPADILQYLDSRPGAETTGSMSIADILGDLSTEVTVEDVEESSSASVRDNDSSIIKLAHQIVLDAYRARASDIHIEPSANKTHTLIRFRVDGTCIEYQRIPGAFRLPLVARFKIMAQLDIAERRLPQDGKIRAKVTDREIDVRVATIPTVGGNEDVILRLLSAAEAIPIDKLGLTGSNLHHLKRAAEKPYGLILCVGPTGSGKTTTLHAVLGHINKPDRKIWTAEDPVEITQAGLRQVQIRPKIGLTFAAALRSFLRADPDVIMVGEMRDRETAAIGVEASLTGHLVLSTLHSNSAVEAVVRLLDLGVDTFNFADALLCVLGQRLVKRICRECRESYQPAAKEADELVRDLGPDQFDKFGLSADRLELFRGRGCAHCNNTGLWGRLAIHEVLVGSDEIKRMIVARASVADLLAHAKEEGMTTLVQDGMIKAVNGLTTIRQVKAVAIK
jgi:type II secretory ATPase GspE/PulE/Tfp pilus assembly ATPase PilB-like protein